MSTKKEEYIKFNVTVFLFPPLIWLMSCLSPHFHILFKLWYLENIASFAKASSSGDTSTILPVSVSRAHLGSSGSYAIFLQSQTECMTKIQYWTMKLTYSYNFRLIIQTSQLANDCVFRQGGKINYSPAEFSLSFWEREWSVGITFQVWHRVVHWSHIKIDDSCAVVRWPITHREDVAKG